MSSHRLKIDLTGMRVLVTGASSGIGLMIAEGLSELGAQLIILSRNRKKLYEAARRIKAKGGKLLVIEADLTKREDIDKAASIIVSEIGWLDAAVFNIGNISCEPCEIHEAGYEDWLESARHYLVAPGYMTSLFLRTLMAERGGTLIYLSSISVREPMRYFVVSDTARSGLSILARAVSRYYASKGIRAYTILLGSFDTPGARRTIARIAEKLGVQPEELWEKEVIGRTPLRRPGNPDELVNLIAYLIVGPSEYMSGSTIVLDGLLTKCIV